MYNHPSHIKTYRCNDCNKDVFCLKWFSISNNLNKGSSYKCENCWDKFDEEFNNFCNQKLKINI